MTTKHNTILNTGKLLLLLILVLVAFGCVPATSVAKGWSGAVVDGTTLYIGSMDGKIMSANTADGRKLWEASLEAAAAPGGGFGCSAPPVPVAIYGSPAVSGNLVYFGGYNNGKFYAFTPGEQEPRWVYPREGVSTTQIVGGALVADGKILFGTASGKVYALNAATGSSANGWIFPADSSQIGKIWSAPASLNGMVFIGSFDGNLYALDIATGQKKWAFETQGALASTPVADNDTVYIGSFDRNLYAVDAATGREKWRFSEAKNWFWAKPLINDGKIYAPSLDGKVYVLDTRSGGKLAEFDLGNAVSASPVMVGNLVIAATEKGAVYSLNTESKEKRQLRDLAEKVDAPLATDGTAVYIHTSAGKLYAVNAQSGAEVWPFISLKSN